MNKHRIEWLTVMLFLFTYSGWLALTAFHSHLPLPLVLISLVFLVTLHSSLQHEVIHGHPSASKILNKALAFPALGLVVAYDRYAILHLEHHRNWLLTDPYDDSESYFFPRAKWQQLNKGIQAILNFNNTLLGRLTIGPAIMICRWFSSELKLCLVNKKIRNDWLLHCLSTGLVIACLVYFEFSIFLYISCVAYPTLSILMLRSYSEHLPEEDIENRSAIIKSNWFMQLLYLNNNYHRVHHDHPGLPWYRLPAMYHREYQNHTTHVYSGYGELIKRYGFTQRYPVEHPFLGKD